MSENIPQNYTLNFTNNFLNIFNILKLLENLVFSVVLYLKLIRTPCSLLSIVDALKRGNAVG